MAFDDCATFCALLRFSQSSENRAEGGAEAVIETNQSLAVMDTAKRENAAELALTAFCWWRADIPPEVCEAYWRDVHGIMFAVAPGL